MMNVSLLHALIVCASLQSEGQAPPVVRELPKMPTRSTLVTVPGGLTARAEGVTLRLPLYPGPLPGLWVDMARDVGFDPGVMDFQARLVARATGLQQDWVVRRRRAVQSRYDAVNAANTVDPHAINSDALRPEVYDLIAWSLQDSRKCIEIEAAAWVRAVEEAALVTGQWHLFDHERASARAALMAREALWSTVRSGPAPVPGHITHDLERTLVKARVHVEPPEVGVALQAYRRVAMEKLQSCVKAFESWFRASTGPEKASRRAYTNALCELFDTQISSAHMIAHAIGVTADEWHDLARANLNPAAAPFIRAQALLRVSCSTVVDTHQRDIMVALHASTDRAMAGADRATRAALRALFLGDDATSDTPESDHREALMVEVSAVNAAVATALAALVPLSNDVAVDTQAAELRAAIARAFREFGEPHAEAWVPVVPNAEWPGPVHGPAAPFVRPASAGSR